MASRLLLALVTAACSASSGPDPSGAGGGTGEFAGASGDAGAGLGGQGGASASGLSVERAIADYRTWQQRTAQPVAISAQIFSLCRLPTLPEQQFASSEHGQDRALLDWLNPGAGTGFAANGATPFPVGAAIVKEKLVPSASGYTLAALGVMIKRQPGFDSPHADWEFAYWEEAPGLLQGGPEAEYCGGCHAGARASDLVFLDESWRTP
jgi:hypothetical protein